MSQQPKQRSLEQLRYLWSVPYDRIARHLNISREQVHKMMGGMFLLDKDGFVRSTSTLTTVEMENYASKIRDWSTKKHKLSIPKPNEKG